MEMDALTVWVRESQAVNPGTRCQEHGTRGERKTQKGCTWRSPTQSFCVLVWEDFFVLFSFKKGNPSTPRACSLPQEHSSRLGWQRL